MSLKFKRWIDDDPPDRKRQSAALYFSLQFWAGIAVFAVIIVPAVVIGTRQSEPVTTTTTIGSTNTTTTLMPTTTPACTFQLISSIQQPLGGVNHGTSISMNVDGAEIAISDTETNSLEGEIRTYSLSGMSWSQSSTTITGSGPMMQLGPFIEMTPDGLHLCASLDQESEVRVYQRNSLVDPWIQKGSSLPSGENTGERCSISDDGNRVAVARPNDGFPAPVFSGRVQVYDYVVSAWMQVGFDIGSSVANARFGSRGLDLSADGSRVFVSSEEAGTHLYVYEFILGGWGLVSPPFGNFAERPPDGGPGQDHEDKMSKGGNYVAEGGDTTIRMYAWSGSTWDTDGVATGTFSLQQDNRFALIETPTPRLMVGTNTRITGGAVANGVSFFTRTAASTWSLLRTVGPFNTNLTGFDVTMASTNGFNCAFSDLTTGQVDTYSCCWNEMIP